MRRILSIVTLLVLSATWTGCVRGDSDSSEGPQDRNMTLTVHVSVPGSSSGGTRAGTQDDAPERNIEELDMLVFRNKDGEGAFKYRSRHSGRLVAESEFRFESMQTEDTDMNHVVFIANAHSDVEAAMGNVNPDEPMDEILEKLTFATGNQWMDVRPGPNKSLPMYGEKADVSLNKASGAVPFHKIEMLRAAARVDVKNAEGGTYGIAEVRVVNTMDKSRLVPDKDVFDEFGEQVKAPSIATGANRLGVDGAIAKQGVQDGGGLWKTSIEGVYVGEAEAGGTYSERNCVLVNIPGAAATDPTKNNWYRIDLVEGTGADAKPRAVLRNYHYTINIKSVTGPGLGTPDEAFNNVPVNVECEILDWEMGMNQDVEFADGYSLKVNRSEVTLYNNGTPNEELTVETTHPEGWKIEDKSDWLTITPTSGNKNDEKPLDFSGTTFAGDDKSREGYFWVQAGNLKKKITVTQVNRDGELSLEVIPGTVYFTKSPKDQQVVTATYFPADATLTMSWTADNIKEWVGDRLPELKGNVVSLRPKEMTDPDVEERTATLTFTLTSADGTEKIEKTVEVIQSAKAVFFEVMNCGDGVTVAAGQTKHIFKVKSATDWSLAGAEPAAYVTDVKDNKLVKWGEGLQIGVETGADYTVTFPANDSWAERIWFFRPHADHESWEEYTQWYVTQSGATPELTVTPSPVDFGAEAEPARIPVKVSTNAKWQYAVTGGDAWVVDTAEDPYILDKAPYGEKDTPATKNEYAVYFGSTTFEVDGKNNPVNPPLPAAGEYKATMTFETRATVDEINEELLPQQATQSVEFRRTVPGYLRPPVNKRALDVYPIELTTLNGGQVTIQFQTNVPWVAGYSVDGKDIERISGTAGEFGLKTEKLQVSGSSEWHLPIPDPNAGSRGVRVFVRPQKGASMAASEPSELYYDLKIDKYYVRKAELTVDGKLINPNAAEPQVFAIGAHNVKASITGNFPPRPFEWGTGFGTVSDVEATDGATVDLPPLVIDKTGWWGQIGLTPYLNHQYIAEGYDGILSLGSFIIMGHDGTLKINEYDSKGNSITSIPSEQESVGVIMTALEGTKLPATLTLEISNDQGKTLPSATANSIDGGASVSWTANIGENEAEHEVVYTFTVRGEDYLGNPVHRSCTLTHLEKDSAPTANIEGMTPPEGYKYAFVPMQGQGGESSPLRRGQACIEIVNPAPDNGASRGAVITLTGTAKDWKFAGRPLGNVGTKIIWMWQEGVWAQTKFETGGGNGTTSYTNHGPYVAINSTGGQISVSEYKKDSWVDMWWAGGPVAWYPNNGNVYNLCLVKKGYKPKP